MGKNFQTQSVSEGVRLLRAVSRPPDRPGRVSAFCGLAASFYSLKTKKNPAARLALGDWFGHYRVITGMGFFWPNLGSRNLLVMIKGALAMVTKGLSQLR